MATARVMAAAATNTTASCLLLRRPFTLKHKPLHFNFNNNKRQVSFPSKRLFSCAAIYNPDVQIKEEGQPETLDYRVFFLDHSGKKVLYLFSLIYFRLVGQKM